MRAIVVAFLLVSACSPALQSDTGIRSVGAEAPPSPSTPPPPVPPAPPNAAAFLAGPDPVLRTTGDARVDAYRERVLREGGIGWRPFLLRLFAGVRANPAILAENEALQAPKDAAGYVRRIVTPERIAAGRRLYAELKGRQLSKFHPNVPPEIIIALWGTMSDYGARPPRFDMIETLLNLGAYGKGPAWSDFDIFHAARLIVEGKADRRTAKAYGNGRIGQVQALLDERGSLGAGGDGDGKVDLWTSRADIFANLAPNDWEPGVPPIIEVERPRFDRSDRLQARMAEGFERTGQVPLDFVGRPGGGAWPEELRRINGRFVEPFGPQGPYYLLTNNFTMLNYKNPFVQRYAPLEADPGFGIAVALLADRIAGRPGPTRPIR